MESVMKLKTLLLVVMAVASAWLGAPAEAGLVIRTDTTMSGSSLCLQSIATDCTGVTTTAEANQCCTTLSDAIDNQRQCFCLLKSYIADQGANLDDYTDVFTECNINGDFDSLCPTGSTPTSTTGSNNPSSPSTDSSTTTSTGGDLGGLGGKNAGNKIATMSFSSLLVIFAALLITRDI